MKSEIQVLEVWGELACFSRPELKVERFSYPIITPSAARGIFDAIYCKPSSDPAQAEFGWRIVKIEVLSMPKFVSLRRNEVVDKLSVRNITRWMAGTSAVTPLVADDDRRRAQRQTVALKDVHYRLHGAIRPWPRHANRIKAFEAQFRRRAARGQCFYQPYLGCREFAAYFRLLEPKEYEETRPPVPWNADLGPMLYDVFDLSRPGSSTDAPSISLFQARVIDGVMEIPEYESDKVLKPEKG